MFERCIIRHKRLMHKASATYGEVVANVDILFVPLLFAVRARAPSIHSVARVARMKVARESFTFSLKTIASSS